jgi:periplasmic divalent cation tolerance protein
MDLSLVYITCNNHDEAKRIGHTLIEEKLVACVNIIDPVTSIYRWQDEIRESTEVILIAKTRSSLTSTIIKRVQELHSYDCPCITAVPLAAVSPAFHRWIEDQTT